MLTQSHIYKMMENISYIPCTVNNCSRESRFYTLPSETKWLVFLNMCPRNQSQEKELYRKMIWVVERSESHWWVMINGVELKKEVHSSSLTGYWRQASRKLQLSRILCEGEGIQSSTAPVDWFTQSDTAGLCRWFIQNGSLKIEEDQNSIWNCIRGELEINLIAADSQGIFVYALWNKGWNWESIKQIKVVK